MTTISTRRQILVNTDPQRRCYNGCNFSEELQWTAWEVIEDTHWMMHDADINGRLKFWQDLNAYSVKIGGNHSEYRVDE